VQVEKLRGIQEVRCQKGSKLALRDTPNFFGLVIGYSTFDSHWVFPRLRRPQEAHVIPESHAVFAPIGIAWVKTCFDILGRAIVLAGCANDSAPLYNYFVRSRGDFGRVRVGFTPAATGSPTPSIDILGSHIGFGIRDIDILFAYIDIVRPCIGFARSISDILSTIILIVQAAMRFVRAAIHFARPFIHIL
jgi:hypothetical protein